MAPKRQPQTERLQVMLSLKTHAYLAILATKGTHGTSIPDAAKTLIEQGIRAAIKDNFLTKDDVSGVQNPK
jgi:hypothetical protein